MKNTILSAAIAAVLAGPSLAAAQSAAEFAELRSALEGVTRRLDALEQQNRALEAKNKELEDKNTKLEESNDKQTDQIAQARAKATSAEWASRIAWKGDLRYRHEGVDPEEAANDQIRHRIRARFGFTAKANDTLNATIQLATNGGANDPRSTNQTLGEGFTRKGVAIDLAYVDWAPTKAMNLQLGKMPYPFQRVPSYFWDGDITVEGGQLKLASGPFFGSAFGYWLQEAGTSSDANMVGAQLGLKGDLGGMKWTAAAMYYDLGAVEGEVTATPAGCAVAFNNAFFGGSQGNTTVTVAGCPRLANDFAIWEALAQLDFSLGSLPLSVFANYAQNTEADALDTAQAAGFTLGRASNPGTWEFGYIYQVTEKDALFGQFVDSDFGGGITDVDGNVFKIGFAPAKNWVLNGTYFQNARFNDVSTTVDGLSANDLDYDRYQIDFNVRFN
jgi:cell division protein FtsB